MPLPAKRKYRPGSRHTVYRSGRISENRIAWLRTAIGQFVLMRYEDPAEFVEDGETIVNESEGGPTYMLILPQNGRKNIRYNFTALTLEELKNIRSIINLLCDLAEPIVAFRDKEAQDALDKGDDSFARVYRQVSQYVVRKGDCREDDQSILQRLADDAARLEDGDDPDRGVRGDRDELAPVEPEDRRAEDDGTQAD